MVSLYFSKGTTVGTVTDMDECITLSNVPSCLYKELVVGLYRNGYTKWL